MSTHILRFLDKLIISLTGNLRQCVQNNGRRTNSEIDDEKILKSFI